MSVVSLERRLSGSASRTMAAMSLGYIVMVTPWAIQEIVAACTNSKVPPFLDFIVTWTAISNSFWNPFIYWLLNAHFRRLGKELFINKCFTPVEEPPTSKSRCCSVSSECDPNMLPLPPGPPSSKPPRTDLEGLSEKFWGEILERTVSSNSLHALQRVYGYKTQTSSILEMNGLTSPDESNRGNALSNFSNSEPRLCEHYHDINCAKTKAFLNGQQPKLSEIGWRKGND
ncbi:hypothetical protein Bhyg_02735 [Pseudolycoriella hygida]|uniref:G-protein coupled receptors family 1 profile domain-containing protein n=1 Tax=Pseudolycoriella hygida TaxID=35572 RepID=A0A9Q0S6T3_9DIPT|nr:hypothetical protein Bhyg_02735 [Pseudolycoriella hygida]